MAFTTKKKRWKRVEHSLIQFNTFYRISKVITERKCLRMLTLLRSLRRFKTGNRRQIEAVKVWVNWTMIVTPLVMSTKNLIGKEECSRYKMKIQAAGYWIL